MPITEFRKIYLPYCLKKQDDGSFIVLNRNHKPIGFTTNEDLVYEDYPISARIKGLTEKAIKKIAYNGVMTDDGFITLYNDACIPTKSKANMQKYLERLELLAAYKIEVGRR
jgi:uncharacterized protein (UPF0248 family)